jgi:TorA maturation chaperone TorD
MKEFLSREEYRGNSYKLLSECYYPPDEKLIKMLNSLEKSRDGLYSEIARNIPRMSDVESLKVDYSKLFVGPYELLAPPYGSVYLEDARRVMGNSTMDAMNKYREEGLDSILKEAPDHIAIELEYMYFLIFKQVEAMRSSDSGSAASYLRKQKAFLESHLGIWVSEFANNVEANGQTEFYKNLARCTRLFVLEDLKSLPDKLTVSFCQTEKIGGMQ